MILFSFLILNIHLKKKLSNKILHILLVIINFVIPILINGLLLWRHIHKLALRFHEFILEETFTIYFSQIFFQGKRSYKMHPTI